MAFVEDKKEEEGWKTRRADSSSVLSDATLPTSGLQRPRNHPSKLGSCSSIDHDGFDQLVGADTEGYQGSSGKVRFVETRLVFVSRKSVEHRFLTKGLLGLEYTGLP